LTPLGTVHLPFDLRGAVLDARVATGGRVEIHYFGES